MLTVAGDLDVVLQPYGAFISRRSSNIFDVINRPATAMLLRLLSSSKMDLRMDTQFVEILIKKGYLLEADTNSSSRPSTQQPTIGFVRERNILKATRAEIEITNRCNLKCIYCYAEANRSKKELSLEQWKLILSGMKDHGLRAVLFSGGEPFIRKDMMKILKWAAHRFIVEVNTNGYYITDEIARELGELNLKSVQVSVDSADSKYHDSVRGKGSHKAALDAINRLVKHGVKVQISCVITKSNARHLEDLKSLANDIGVAFKADPITRTGFAKNIDESEWRQKYQSSSGSRVEPSDVEENQLSFTPVCQSQVGYVAVSHGGLLKPCNMRETFFEPVGTDLFCDHDSAWWNRFYGESQLGSIGVKGGVTENDFSPYFDTDGRYICSMQSLYMNLNNKKAK